MDACRGHAQLKASVKRIGAEFRSERIDHHLAGSLVLEEKGQAQQRLRGRSICKRILAITTSDSVQFFSKVVKSPEQLVFCLQSSWSRLTQLNTTCQQLWLPSPEPRVPVAQSPVPVASVAFVVDVAVPVAAERHRRRVTSVVLPCSPHLKVLGPHALPSQSRTLNRATFTPAPCKLPRMV